VEEVATAVKRSVPAWARLVLVFVLLYVFLVGVKSLEGGIEAFGAGFAERLFDLVASPISGLSAGILATVLVQSSSVSTATIVGLVGSGALSVGAAVPMIMGANIGTSVTNTLASLGHLRRGAEFRRAFAGATMHDFFNIAAVAIMLPLELLTGVLSRSADAISDLVLGKELATDVATSPSPIKSAIKAPIGAIEALIGGFGGGIRGVILLIVGLTLIFLALTFITRNMRLAMAGRIEASMNAILSRGAGVGAIVVGILITVAVQSSSITTSVLVPMVGAGILTLENAYPVTLGANLGTTITALLASIAADRPEALTVALTHTLFNLAGILVFYPVPRMRRLPIEAAMWIAKLAAERKQLVLYYILGIFIVLPVLGVLLF